MEWYLRSHSVAEQLQTAVFQHSTAHNSMLTIALSAEHPYHIDAIHQCLRLFRLKYYWRILTLILTAVKKSRVMVLIKPNVLIHHHNKAPICPLRNSV
jgi:hypothetical protein